MQSNYIIFHHISRYSKHTTKNVVAIIYNAPTLGKNITVFTSEKTEVIKCHKKYGTHRRA